MTELQHTLIDHNIRVAGFIPEEESAAALGMAGSAAEAEKAFLEEVRLAPESKTNWHNLGMLYVNQSRWNVARNCFLRVHELDEKDGFAVCRIIELNALLKDVPSVEKWCIWPLGIGAWLLRAVTVLFLVVVLAAGFLVVQNRVQDRIVTGRGERDTSVTTLEQRIAKL